MSEKGTERSKELSGGPGAASRTFRILFMDDKDFVRRAVCEVLEALGYDVESAADGGELLEKYRSARDAEKPFDIVVADLTVERGMGGKEAIETLRALDPSARIIVSSGFADDPVMIDHRTYGVAAVIAKPYNSAELDAIIRQVLRAPA